MPSDRDVDFCGIQFMSAGQNVENFDVFLFVLYWCIWCHLFELRSCVMWRSGGEVSIFCPRTRLDYVCYRIWSIQHGPAVRGALITECFSLFCDKSLRVKEIKGMITARKTGGKD